MARWDEEKYRADLRALSNDALCERLRGRYNDGATTYRPEPLMVEAARRIEELEDNVEFWKEESREYSKNAG